MKSRILTAFLLIPHATAFGPFSPIQNVQSNEGGMTMRVGKTDLLRRQKFNKILQTVQPNPTKERVENALLSQGTSTLIEKCNWKLRKSMIRKVKVQVNRFDTEIDQKFGQPMSLVERIEMEKSVGEANKVKKAAFAKKVLEESIERAEKKVMKQAAEEAARAAADAAKAEAATLEAVKAERAAKSEAAALEEKKAEAVRFEEETEASNLVVEEVIADDIVEEVEEVPDSEMKETAEEREVLEPAVTEGEGATSAEEKTLVLEE